jgi:DNA-binding SARP family transcriptional activator
MSDGRAGADHPAAPAETVHVALLGGFGVALGDAPLASPGSARLRLLLAYLALHGALAQSRAHAAFVLWPDSSESQARTNLRNLLHRLRRTLPPLARLLTTGSSTLTWRPNVALQVDVAEFEAHAAAANAASACGEAGRAREHLEQALAVYRGDLLHGSYDEWVITERQRLTGLLLQCAEQLVRLLDDERDYTSAITVAMRILQYDPLDEAAYRRLIRLQGLAGDRAGARRVYAECVEVLRRELDVEPDRATHEAYLRAQRPIASQLRDGGGQNGLPRLVGRRHEWTRLRDWFRADRPNPCLLLIEGEAGIGKTRLAQELGDWRRVNGDDIRVASCYHAAVPYAPITSWLRASGLQRGRGLADWLLVEVDRILPGVLAARPDLVPRPITEDWQLQHFFEAVARALVPEGRSLMFSRIWSGATAPHSNSWHSLSAGRLPNRSLCARRRELKTSMISPPCVPFSRHWSEPDVCKEWSSVRSTRTKRRNSLRRWRDAPSMPAPPKRCTERPRATRCTSSKL